MKILQTSEAFLEKGRVHRRRIPRGQTDQIRRARQARIKKFTELAPAIEFMFKAPLPDKTILCWKKQSRQRRKKS